MVGRKGKFFAAHYFCDFAGPKNWFVSKSHKIVETLYSNGGTFGEQNNQRPSPPLHSRLGCLQFSTGSSKSGTPFHGGDGESFIFSFLSWQTVREALKGNVSQLILSPNWKGPFYLREFWSLHQVEYWTLSQCVLAYRGEFRLVWQAKKVCIPSWRSLSRVSPANLCSAKPSCQTLLHVTLLRKSSHNWFSPPKE